MSIKKEAGKAYSTALSSGKSKEEAKDIQKDAEAYLRAEQFNNNLPRNEREVINRKTWK